ncbi:hypothetical protein GGR50DRAFT_391374 [Xylaria sp. CBS 124048]|nr:hypothetical protein GGR50DRAFT_391374 [Xylaria sp. CBS 124048]
MDLLDAVYNHLVLPPRVPGAQDADIESVSECVLARFIHACESIIPLVGSPWSEAYQSVRFSLEACRVLSSGRLEKSTVRQYLSQLQPGHVLILHVIEQNAALLVRCEDWAAEQHVIFEAFETSAASEQVLAAGNTLQWDFPSHSAQVRLGDLLEEPFQESLAEFLEQASMESIYSLQASARKAQVSVTETRDTSSPALITHMLMPLLEAVGSRFQSPGLRKRIRDEVNINNADLPWRRLPFWLVLRVAAQRQLCLRLGNEQGRIGYKFLMCLLLAGLLKDSAGRLRPELVITLRAKLCRRMVKLEKERSGISAAEADIYESLFAQVSPVIEAAVEEANDKVVTAWENFKQATTRRVTRLPRYAPDSSLSLSLPNSGAYLDNVLNTRFTQQVNCVSDELPPSNHKAVTKSREFTDRIFSLAAMETRAVDDKMLDTDTLGHPEVKCVELAAQIRQVFSEIGTTYDSDPEQMSTIILCLFSLWVCLDKCAIRACRLLEGYRPVFSPELLNVLHLPTMSGMRRLQDIQTYLDQRCSGSRYGTILDMNNKNSLAVRYVAGSADMQTLCQHIQAASDQACDDKKKEWEEAYDEFEDLTIKVSEGVCCCSWHDGQRDVRGCTKCWHWRCRNRVKIQIQEAFLPKGDPARSSVVFELGIPGYLSAYRNATWQILHRLAHPSRPVTSAKPEIILNDCQPLKRYMTTEMHGISLASTVKCFTQTHYKFINGMVPLDRVVLPFAARFQLYDNESGLWVGDLQKPLTLEHICGIHIPQGLKSTILQMQEHPPPNIDGPSSYEILANQMECPPDMSVHEFSAYQKLLAGKMRRWPNILVEMNSSNLNFSSEDTRRVVCQLAVQAGPRMPGGALRAVHAVFEEPAFLERLVEMIETRLHSIRDNWREHNCMELLITLSLRLFSLSADVWKQRAGLLLKVARDATLDWTTRLRNEINVAKDANAAQSAATYGFLAALLCRRTFATLVESCQLMNAEELTAWVQASVALQENLMIDIDKLSQELKSLLIRDTKMAYYIRPILAKAVISFPASVSNGIRRNWSNSNDDASQAFSVWKFLPAPHERWIVARTSPNQQAFGSGEVVLCNVVEGHLLVNGEPRGKLPLEIRDDPMVKRLFQNRHLLTYPSSLPGMSYRLAGCIESHEIHFGIRGGKTIIRARTGAHCLELVPEGIFGNQVNFDLPAELVDHCVHWLNLSTKCLEIRRVPKIWIRRQRDWEIDIPGRRAYRANVRMVDPCSAVSAKVVEIFQHLVEPRKVTIYQPTVGRMVVDIREWGLSFHVNNNDLLECRQLGVEIDPNQDAGTWYGLESKIVLRDLVSAERSIIVPLGKPSTRRRGMHVEVHISSNGVPYGRYKINDILGQLSCPPEPRLVYTKALCHAMTSFCLPDALTGRTGTEESISILRSGVAQPWVPVRPDTGAYPVLEALKSLSPRREYYPANSKRLQSVQWDAKLTTTIQHESYESLVHDIMRKSARLSRFSAADTLISTPGEPSYLHQRGEARRLLYERSIAGASRWIVPDKVYVPRDQKVRRSAANVYEVARLVQTRCANFHMKGTILSVLESFEAISGFQSTGSLLPNMMPLVTQIEEPINQRWGQLLEFCRLADHPGPVLFRLGLLAFHPHHSMDMIRTFAAFSALQDLKSLKPPLCNNFVDFKFARQKPPVELLERLVSSARRVFEPKVLRKRKWQDEAGRTLYQHESLCEMEARQFASYVLGQWPVPANEISTGKFKTDVIDFALALDNISPEWERRRYNRELEAYIGDVQASLDSINYPWNAPTVVEWTESDPAFISNRQSQVVPTLAGELVTKPGPGLELLEVSPPNILSGVNNLERQMRPRTSTETGVPKEVKELERILNYFKDSAQALRCQYGSDLLQSLASLKYKSLEPEPEALIPTFEEVQIAIERARIAMRQCHDSISLALGANDRGSAWLQLGGMWPCTAPTSLLEVLRTKRSVKFGTGMKEALVHYGLSITHLQRFCRIHSALQKNDRRALAEELRNAGHENWQPLLQPDWLLLEVDGDFLIRPEQVEVAWAIISPNSGKNSVVQMNMGQGKTSCIMPMAAALLANGKNLVRLIVPKALLRPTAQVMQSRLGGLVGREIRHIQFSRKTPTTPETLSEYTKLHMEIHGASGLILTSHENILSYKLGGWQSLTDGKFETAGDMIDFQRWMTEHCRDILDECDFTLSVKTQLNYPGGRELAVDGHPFRWRVAQELLSLVFAHIPALRREFPASVEVLRRAGLFPMIHFHRRDVEDALQDRILDDICAGRSAFIRPVHVRSSNWRENIRRALLEEKPSKYLLEKAASALINPQMAYKALLVVRGLLVNRILLLCLNKRWNVQYGLHPGRHPVAVPFEAKGIPSELSEFGHPDVAILFTCLSFYYSGLTCKQFSQGLQHILHSDDPAAQYEQWTSSCNSLPSAFRHWNVIHVDDMAQVEELWKYLRFDSTVINHYLNNFVFPAHAKQFDVKLQTSAWDLPLFPKRELQGAKTTGFSGTNDNRIMLPLTIRQDDLPSLQQTSAEVLSYLLQPRNRGYEVTSDFQGRRLTEEDLLRKLCDADIHILIDAGAYILEMDNMTLARKWLQTDKRGKKAAVYFGVDNQAWVYHREETKGGLPLLATPFADDLSDCLIYIDEAHTRGVDMKFPVNAHGALTLALKQTKDYTMQAAMRLRQLRTTQSVTFFAPPEVDQSIKDFCRPAAGEKLASPHVICWLLEQTCRTNEELQGLYVAQGINFCRRTDAEWRYQDFLDNDAQRARLLDVLRQPEHLTLEQLYGGSSTVSLRGAVEGVIAPQLRQFTHQLIQFNGDRDRSLTGAFEEVEQEREVQEQLEQVRQVQKPTRPKALEFTGLHPHIERFVQTGVLPDSTPDKGPDGFMHVLTYVAQTSIGKKYDVRSTGSRLFVSNEFERTVKVGKDLVDNFLVSGQIARSALCGSPFYSST